jgi:HlyD family secretion protein
VSPDANASSLFLIAKDLAKMQIWALVNEADIGRVRVGQQVNFTVAAYPREHFHGTVGQIRLNAQPMQNVIAYTVVVAIDNSSHRLLPYLTADVKFEIGRRRNVLRAPNEALRWKPTQEQRSAGGSEGDNLLWLVDKDGKHVRSIAVQTGLNDGTVTEVSGPEIKEGMEVVVDEASPWGSSRGESDNPFRPQIRRPTDGR